MIKLQLLLRRPSRDIALDPALRAMLEQHGFVITASGRATVSAEMTGAHFEQLFGFLPPSAELPVPAPLQETISLSTLTPRHSALHEPRVNHAAI